MRYVTKRWKASDDKHMVDAETLRVEGHELLCVVPTLFQQEDGGKLRVLEYEVIYKPYKILDDDSDHHYKELNHIRTYEDKHMSETDLISPFRPGQL